MTRDENNKAKASKKSRESEKRCLKEDAIERSISNSIVLHTMTFFGYVDLKRKRVGYPSVMNFEGRLASDPVEICDLFVEFIQRTYTDDFWVPSDPGPEHVLDDSPFGALQFTSDEVESVSQDLDVNKGSAPMAYHRSF
jgi:hypothetical protein